MPINAVCPECRASYVLGDQQKGKKVRCKKCQAVFVAGAAQPRKVDEPLDVEVVAEPPRPKTRPAPSSISSRRTTPPPRAARDEDEDRRPARRDRDDRDDRPRRGSALPWAIAGIVVGLLLLIGGGIAVVFAMRGDDSKQASHTPPADTTPVGGPQVPANPQQPLGNPLANPNPPVQPVNPQPNPQPINPQPIDPTPVKPADPPPIRPEDPSKPPADPPSDPPASGGNGQISPQMVVKVKRATVYLKVTMADGTQASGTGFFGAPEGRNLILTNAHVVGMLSPESRRPRAIEVYINSGQADERRTTARVLGVDRSSDLAVLDVGTTDGMPEPLTVKSAAALVELTKLYTFGFPLGERLGKEITIRDTSVSALRKKHGALDRIQVNGGMDPGNSGGPVVDGNGHVVGVAVAGIPGRQINFAIPGDRVHTILNGRIAALGSGIPYLAENRQVAFPLTIEMIDPRNRIQKVALDVWTGNTPAPGREHRPAADVQPGAEPGDSQHLRYEVPYDHGIARGDIVLPELPSGKSWWIQPNWVDAAGRTRWAVANVWKPVTEPVERKPATLALRFVGGVTRPLTLSSTNTFKISESDDDEDTLPVMRTKVVFNEIAQSNGAGTTLNLKYNQVSRDFSKDKATRPSRVLAAIREDLKLVTTVLQLDALGNVTANTLNIPQPNLIRPNRTVLQAYQQKVQAIKEFHEPVKAALDSLSVPLPGKEVKPLETWKATRPLPIDTVNRFEYGLLDVTFTYLGQRNRKGKDEAVIAIDGVVRGAKGKEADLGGKATGMVLVDLATGQVTQTETRVTVEIEGTLTDPDEPAGGKSIRVLTTQVSRLERGL